MRSVREALAELTGAAVTAVAGIAMFTTTATKTTGKKTPTKTTGS